MTKLGLPLALAVLLAAPCLAGPCIDCDGDGVAEYPWRSDLPIPGPPLDRVGKPDIAWPDAAPERLLVVWSGQAPGSPGADIFLARSLDGGCTWTTRNLTNSLEPEVEPSIAADDAGRCVAILFNRVTGPAQGTGSIYLLASDDGGATFRPEVKLSTGPSDGHAREPDVAATPGLLFPAQYHAVWQHLHDTGSGVEERVYYLRSLGLCATPPLGWRGAGSPPAAAESLLSTGITDDGCDLDAAASGVPRVAADTAGNPPTLTNTGTSVVWRSRCGSDNRIYFTRSNTNGDSFYGQENPPRISTPLRIDAPGSMPVGFLDIDSSDLGTGSLNWNPVAWMSTGPPGAVLMDAQNQSGRNVNTNWSATDVVLGAAADPARAMPAIASAGNATPGADVLYWLVWSTGAPDGDLEFQPGRLINGVTPPIELLCRSRLPAPVTGIDPVPRGAGGADLPAAEDDGASLVAIAWRDTRDVPGGAIWFKRLDRDPPGAPAVLSAVAEVCPGNDIDVTFAPVADCDIAHYRVTTSEPTIPAVIVLPPATGAHVDVPDTLQGVAVDVTVHAVDRACNEAASGPLAVVTPRCARLAQDTLRLDVSCNGGADDDGEPDPGETVDLWLPISNLTGTAAATGISATLSVTAPPSGVRIDAGVSAYPDLPVGSAATDNLTPFRVHLDNAIACPSRVALRLDVTTDQVPATLAWFLEVGANGCDASCVPPCTASAILPIERLLGAKLPGFTDLRFEWRPDGQALSGYNLAWVTRKSQLPACGSGCAGSSLVPGCDPTGAPGSTSCDHPGAVTNLAEPRRYYNVRGVCRGQEAAE